MPETHELMLHDRYVNRRMPALGKEHHYICTCGWQGPWVDAQEPAETRCPKEPIAARPQ
jgi:hypothetical protein